MERINGIMIRIITVLFFCIVLPLLVFVIFSLIGHWAGRIWPSAVIVGNITGIVFCTISLAAMLYGLIYGWKTLQVKHVDLFFDSLPSEFEGYTIAQLSDLHVGSHGSDPTFLKKVVKQVNDEHPDMIVNTGDLINILPDESKPFEQVLSTLHAHDGVFSVLGNHDYNLYGLKKRKAHPHERVMEVIQSERRIGWNLLLNDHCMITRNGAKIAIVGVENIGKRPFPNYGDLKGAMKGLPNDVFKILLSHDPSHWHMEVLPETDIPLTLSGHTHAAQLRIGKWSPVKWIYPEWSGLYTEGERSLYVSEGLGGSIPFRLGATPEIIMFTLHKK